MQQETLRLPRFLHHHHLSWRSLEADAVLASASTDIWSAHFLGCSLPRGCGISRAGCPCSRALFDSQHSVEANFTGWLPRLIYVIRGGCARLLMTCATVPPSRASSRMCIANRRAGFLMMPPHRLGRQSTRSSILGWHHRGSAGQHTYGRTPDGRRIQSAL